MARQHSRLYATKQNVGCSANFVVLSRRYRCKQLLSDTLMGRASSGPPWPQGNNAGYGMVNRRIAERHRLAASLYAQHVTAGPNSGVGLDAVTGTGTGTGTSTGTWYRHRRRTDCRWQLPGRRCCHRARYECSRFDNLGVGDGGRRGCLSHIGRDGRIGVHEQAYDGRVLFALRCARNGDAEVLVQRDVGVVRRCCVHVRRGTHAVVDVGTVAAIAEQRAATVTAATVTG